MLDFEVLLSGFLQGVCEFLPISSSAHIVLFVKNESFINVILLHFATLVAVIVFFSSEVKKLFYGFIDIILFRRSRARITAIQVLITFVPFAVAGFVVDKFITFEKSKELIGCISVIFGIILYLTDMQVEKSEKMNSYKHALIISLLQIISIVPGVSRLGITMSGLRALGYTKIESFRFSLLISIPVILSGNIWYVFKAVVLSDTAVIYESSVIVSCVVAFLVGLVTLNVFSNALRYEKTIKIIAVYRILFGVYLLL